MVLYKTILDAIYKKENNMIQKKKLGNLLVDIYINQLGEIPTIVFLLESGMTDIEIIGYGFLSTDIDQAQEIMNNQ